MARLIIPSQSMVVTGSYPTLPIANGSADVAWTDPTDQTDRYGAIVDLKTMVWAWNDDVVSHTVTITSVVDPYERTGNMVVTVAAGKIVRLGPFGLVGWQHEAPLHVPALWIDVDDAALLLAILNLP